MGVKRYLKDLTAVDQVRVRIVVSERGSEVEDFSVQYEAIVDGVLYPVVRFDCAHGYAHRDTLDAEGRNVDKLWFAGWDLATALNHALDDIRDHYQDYRADFLRRLRHS
jgi:hypothetical protein